MSPYSAVVALTIAANVWILGFVALRMNRRLPRNALILFLAAFTASHGISIGLAEGALVPSWQGFGFATLVLGYTALALFALLFLYGEGLRHRMPTITLVLVPGVALASLGAVAGWRPEDAFRLATDPVSVAINGYLVLCLGVALAESLAVWRRSPGRAPEAFPLVAGSVALAVAGPFYGFELVVLGLQSFTGTNLAVPVAAALFALAMARGNPVPFKGRAPEGARRVPWMVTGGAYLLEETRPKYAQAMFLAASHASPALAMLSEPEANVPDLAGVEAVRLPPGERCASVLASTAAEFLYRNRTGVVLVHDASYAVANSGLAATVTAIRRVAAGMPATARLIVSLANLTPEERQAFDSIGARTAAPDVEAELAAILEKHLGAATDPLARAALARGKRVDDLTLIDLPHVRDYLLASLADLRAPADEAAHSGWRRVSQALAADLETLWRTPPSELRPAREEGAPPAATDIPIVRASDVLEAVPAAEPHAPVRSLGGAVRDAFLGSLGSAGEPVYRRVMGRLRKDAASLGPEDLPKVAELAEEALDDLGGAIDVPDAKRDLVERAQRLRAQLHGLARGER